MSTYLVTGVSRGIGFGFLTILSADPANTVFGLVRDKAATDKKVASELGDRKNIHILKADLVDYDALKASVEYVSKVTGGSLDYIIANGAMVPLWSAYDSIGVLGQSREKFEEDLRTSFEVNVIGNIHLFNLYTPLVLAGRGKKVVAISSGMADTDFISQFSIEAATPYAVSKAGTNVVVAKFSAQYAGDGVLFMSICPGMVETGLHDNATPEQLEGLMKTGERFQAYAPHFKGAATVEESVTSVLSVMDKASIEGGSAGSFVSHFGNKQWM